MWKFIFRKIFQFLSNHTELILSFVLIIVAILTAKYCFEICKYGNAYNRKKYKLERRQEFALAKLSGKKPCRMLKLRKKFLSWKLKQLKHSMSIVNIKLDNTQEILDKYSYE